MYFWNRNSENHVNLPLFPSRVLCLNLKMIQNKFSFAGIMSFRPLSTVSNKMRVFVNMLFY